MVSAFHCHGFVAVNNCYACTRSVKFGMSVKLGWQMVKHYMGYYMQAIKVLYRIVKTMNAKSKKYFKWSNLIYFGRCMLVLYAAGTDKSAADPHPCKSNVRWHNIESNTSAWIYETINNKRMCCEIFNNNDIASRSVLNWSKSWKPW